MSHFNYRTSNKFESPTTKNYTQNSDGKQENRNNKIKIFLALAYLVKAIPEWIKLLDLF